MFLSIPKISIAGISACVPKESFENLDKAFIEYSGIERRRISDLKTSELCFHAAKQLLSELGWTKVDYLIFISQTADYQLPSTSCILQNRLGLDEETACFDISLACSGWVYGLSASMKGRGLLLVGDTLSGICDKNDSATYPIFGNAGTATALESKGEGFKFHLGTNGAGYENIIKKDQYLKMNGLGVFGFVIKKVPESIKLITLKYNLSGINYYVFHQSNRSMIESVARKLNISKERIPLSLKDFGNTSSASIPLTLLTNQITGKIVACGYGAGLSWGSVYMNLDCHYTKLIEI